MAKLIINADDFGYSRGVNHGIVDAHTQGILTSTTVMANMPGFDHAVELSKVTPSLGIGVHLTLTCGKPLLITHKTIVDSDGNFRKLAFYDDNNEHSLDEVYEEWDAQITKCIEAGIQPTHLDSHHHTHTFSGHEPIIIKLARKYNLPVRGNLDLPEDIKSPKRFIDTFDGIGQMPEHRLDNYLKNLLDDVKHYGTVEIMTHPAYLDVDITEGSSFTEPRMHILEFLMNSSFSKKLLKDDSIELVTFKAL